jgi:23S rRNA (pseudouridine1915-N3)-methyltransferase
MGRGQAKPAFHALITVGKPKAAYIAQGLADYAARLGPYGGCELVAAKAPRPGKAAAPAAVMAAEGAGLLARVGPRDLLWALDRRGGAWSSRRWARELEAARAGGAVRLCLVIGGAEGLAPEVLERAGARVSLGPATLPHELAALVALEQLYRAHTMLAGTPYHRD